MEEARMKCPTCGSEFPAGARFCPKCGYVVPTTAPAGYADPIKPNVVYVESDTGAASWAPWVAALSLALLVAGGVALWNMGYFSNEPSTTIVAAPEPQTPPAQVNITERSSPPDVHVTVPPAKTQPPVIVTPPPVIRTEPPVIVTPPPASPPPPDKMPEIVSVTGRTLETGSADWRYGYTVKLRNTTRVDQVVDLKITFLDGAGYVVDDVLVQDVRVPANSSKLYDGDALIRSDLAGTIKTVKAEFM